MAPKPRDMPQQAFSPSYRSPRAGYRQRGGSSLYYTDGTKIPGARIDARPQAARMMGGPSEGPIAQRGNQFTPTRPAPTRQSNIDAARADGTFDAKRAAFNAANKGSYMDEKGTIGPKAPLPTGNPANERVPVSTPSTPPATTPPAAKPEVMGPPRPATFEGKSRAEWFGAAAKRQGQSNAYSNEAIAEATKKPATPASSPSAEKPAPVAEAAKPVSSPSTASATSATPTPAGVPPPTFDDPAAKERYNKGMASISPDAKPAPATPSAPTSAPSPSKDSWFSNASKGLTQGAQSMMADRAVKERRIAELENRATPGTTKIARGAVDAAKGFVNVHVAGAQAINKGVPAAASALATGAENLAKATVAKAKEVTAPARTWVHGDQNAAAEAAKLKAELNPTPPKPYVPTYTGGSNPPVPTAAMGNDDEKKKRVASK
jgi:hypothetical protein